MDNLDVSPDLQPSIGSRHTPVAIRMTQNPKRGDVNVKKPMCFYPGYTEGTDLRKLTLFIYADFVTNSRFPLFKKLLQPMGLSQINQGYHFTYYFKMERLCL